MPGDNISLSNRDLRRSENYALQGQRLSLENGYRYPVFSQELKPFYEKLVANLKVVGASGERLNLVELYRNAYQSKFPGAHVPAELSLDDGYSFIFLEQILSEHVGTEQCSWAKLRYYLYQHQNVLETEVLLDSSLEQRAAQFCNAVDDKEILSQFNNDAFVADLGRGLYFEFDTADGNKLQISGLEFYQRYVAGKDGAPQEFSITDGSARLHLKKVLAEKLNLDELTVEHMLYEYSQQIAYLATAPIVSYFLLPPDALKETFETDRLVIPELVTDPDAQPKYIIKNDGSRENPQVVNTVILPYVALRAEGGNNSGACYTVNAEVAVRAELTERGYQIASVTFTGEDRALLAACFQNNNDKVVEVLGQPEDREINDFQKLLDYRYHSTNVYENETNDVALKVRGEVIFRYERIQLLLDIWEKARLATDQGGAELALFHKEFYSQVAKICELEEQAQTLMVDVYPLQSGATGFELDLEKGEFGTINREFFRQNQTANLIVSDLLEKTARTKLYLLGMIRSDDEPQRSPGVIGALLDIFMSVHDAEESIINVFREGYFKQDASSTVHTLQLVASIALVLENANVAYQKILGDSENQDAPELKRILGELIEQSVAQLQAIEQFFDSNSLPRVVLQNVGERAALSLGNSVRPEVDNFYRDNPLAANIVAETILDCHKLRQAVAEKLKAKVPSSASDVKSTNDLLAIFRPLVDVQKELLELTDNQFSIINVTSIEKKLLSVDKSLSLIMDKKAKITSDLGIAEQLQGLRVAIYQRLQELRIARNEAKQSRLQQVLDSDEQKSKDVSNFLTASDVHSSFYKEFSDELANAIGLFSSVLRDQDLSFENRLGVNQKLLGLYAIQDKLYNLIDVDEYKRCSNDDQRKACHHDLINIYRNQVVNWVRRFQTSQVLADDANMSLKKGLIDILHSGVQKYVNQNYSFFKNTKAKVALLNVVGVKKPSLFRRYFTATGRAEFEQYKRLLIAPDVAALLGILSTSQSDVSPENRLIGLLDEFRSGLLSEIKFIAQMTSYQQEVRADFSKQKRDLLAEKDQLRFWNIFAKRAIDKRLADIDQKWEHFNDVKTVIVGGLVSDMKEMITSQEELRSRMKADLMQLIDETMPSAVACDTEVPSEQSALKQRLEDKKDGINRLLPTQKSRHGDQVGLEQRSPGSLRRMFGAKPAPDKQIVDSLVRDAEEIVRLGPKPK